MKRILTYLSIIILAFSTISCGKKPELDGEWKITSVNSETVELSEASPSLTFNTGRLHGYTGVNILNGEYIQEGRRLSLKGIGVTMMAGPDEDMNIERQILAAFENIYTAKITDDGILELYNEDGEVIMTLLKKNTAI